MKLSDNTAISMPMRNLLAILIAVACGIFAYTEITGRLTSLKFVSTLLSLSITPKYAQTPTPTAANIDNRFLIGILIAVLSDSFINRHRLPSVLPCRK